MKKILSLILAFALLLAVFSAVPTVSAEEVEYTLINKKTRYKYWPGFSSGDIVKIGDWYYGYSTNYFTKETSLTTVCGYDGNETVITIPTESYGYKFKNIEAFRIFSDTVETVIIPKEITQIEEGHDGVGSTTFHGDESYFLFDGNTSFKEIIVDAENEKYMSQDGVLFSKSGSILYFYPPKKPDIEYTVPSTVYKMETGAIWYPTHLKSLTIPQNVKYIYQYSITKSLEELYFDNTNDLIGDTIEQIGIEPDEIFFEGPKIPRGTIHCIYGTPLYKYYNKSWNKGYFYNELKVIPRKDGESLIKENGVWYYYDNGEKTDKSTLVKHSGKWFYVTNGVWDKTVTDKVVTYKNKSFYIKNGKWDSSVNTLTKKNGEWLGIVNGKWDTSANTLIKYKGKWFYVKNGEWCKKTAIVKYKGKRFYVKNGKVDFDFSGKKKIDGKTYKIKNGNVA